MTGRLMLALAGDTVLLPQDEAMLQNPAVGGVILFSRNFAGSTALRQLTAAIRRAAARPLLIAADHEGGRVQRFRTDDFLPLPPMRQLAAATDADQLLYAAGMVLAADLLAHGVDMTFAPVLDVDYGVSEIIGDRAFSAEPERVAACAAHVARGLAAAGMPACGKHFPGHGFVAADSHVALPEDTRGFAELEADMLPFKRFAAAGGAMLMSAHVVYRAVDDKPATFSPRWLREILREKIGYQGLVVCDDLCMAGAAALGDMAARLHAAADAGCDLLLSCQPQENAAALAAVPELSEGGAAWQQLASDNTARLTVGDAEYHEARARLAAFAAGE